VSDRSGTGYDDTCVGPFSGTEITGGMVGGCVGVGMWFVPSIAPVNALIISRCSSVLLDATVTVGWAFSGWVAMVVGIAVVGFKGAEACD